MTLNFLLQTSDQGMTHLDSQIAAAVSRTVCEYEMS